MQTLKFLLLLALFALKSANALCATDEERWKEQHRQEILRQQQLPIQTDTMLAEVPLQQVPIPDCVTTGTLKNGLTYYIVHNEEKLRQADFYLVQRTGSLVEEDGQEGVAHLVEHMLFCGTKHFSEQQLLDYFRRIGVHWGNELNATTDFHETVYKLRNVPLHMPHSADSSLLLLRDWAGDALFPADQLETERTVVLEEFRKKQQDKYAGKYYQFMYPNSLYAKRLAIGKEEVIKRVSAKELKAFYRKWYQPQHQAVIVVGDVDKEAIEKKIKSLFGDLKRGKSEIPDYSVHVEKQARPRVCIHPVKGRTNVSISFNYHCPRQNDREYLNSIRSYVESRTNAAIINKWRKRMERLQKDHPEITGVGGEFKELIVEGDMPLNYFANMKDSLWKEGLTFMVQELEKIHRYGWKWWEAYESPTLMSGDGAFPEIKNWKEECDVNEGNNSIVQDLVRYFVRGVRIGASSNFILMARVFNHMNPAQAYQRLKRMENDSLLTIIIDVPDSPDFQIPTADEVLDVIQTARESDLYESRYQYALALEPQIREVLDSIQVVVTPGKILNAKELPFPSCTVMELSNGISLIHIKSSSFCHLSIEGFRPSGRLRFSGNDYWQARFFADAESLPYRNQDRFYGSLSYHDLEDNFKFVNDVDMDARDAFFKMFYLTLANTELDSAKLMKKVADNIKSLKSKPQRSLYHYNRLDSLILVDPTPYQNWTLEKYESISYARVQELYRQYKSNYNGTVMILKTSSGSELKDFTPYIEKYIASLPALPDPVRRPDCPDLRWKDEDLSLTDYTREDSLRAECTLIYNQDIDYQYNAESRIYLQALNHVLHQLLENKLRLEQGNIYSVNNNFTSWLAPYHHQALQVSFTCPYQHIRQFIATTDSVIDAIAHGELLTQPILDGYIHAKEKFVTTEKKKNAELSQTLLSSYRSQEFPIKNDYDWPIVENMTVEKLRAFAALLLDKGHRYEYVTMPKWMKENGILRHTPSSGNF